MSDPQNLNQSGTLNTGAPPPEVPILDAPGTNAPQPLPSSGGSSSGGSGGGPTLLSIAITPTNPTPSIGQQQQFTAIGTFSSGPPQNLTSAVLWVSSDTTVGTITNGTTGGDFTVVGTGNTNVSASFEGKTSNVVPIAVAGAEFLSAGPFPNGNVTNGGTPTVYTRAMYIPSDVAVLTARIGNRADFGPVGGGVDISSNIAIYKSNGSGLTTGNPLSKWLAQTISGTGADWVAPTPTTVQRGTDGKIVMLMSLDALAVATDNGQLNYGGYSAGTAVVDPAPAITGVDPNPICLLHYDFITSRKRVVVFGDSISVGVLAATGFEISCFYQLGPNKDYAVEQVGLPGGTLNQFSQFNGAYSNLWTDILFNPGVEAWIQLGVNDILGGSTAMINAFTTIVNHLNALGVAKIFANTIPAQASYADPGQTIRNTYNAFVRANSLGLTGIGDFDTKQNVGGLNDNVDPTMLYAPFSADGTHWTDAGQNQAYTIVAATIG